MSAVLESIDTGADINANTSSDTAPSDASAGGSSGSAQTDGTQPGGGGDQQSAAVANNDASEPAAAAQPNAGGEGKDKLVPLSALHEARSELKALRAELTELRAKPFLTPTQQAQLDKLAQQEAAASKPKEPDFLEDPKGYVDAQLGKTASELKTVKEENQRLTQTQQQQNALSQMLGHVAQHEAAYLKTAPDYHQAVEHSRSVRTAQLQMIYPQATPEQIAQQITREEIGAAAQVLQAGGNPADFIYKYAKTLGYAPKVPVPPPTTNANGAGTPDKDAVRTLGNGGGADQTDETPDDELGGALKSALAERFGVRKRK